VSRGLAIFALLGAATPALAEETWAGHQITWGRRDIPFLGRIEFRTDSYVIARATRTGQYLELEQVPCRVDFPVTFGVTIDMEPSTLQALPPAVVQFELLAFGKARSGSWFVGWGSEDLDEDGEPGVTVKVDAPLCGGDIYVANGATSQAAGRLTADGMVGDVWVHVQQEVLDASNLCLLWFSSETDERQQGTFAYRRVEESATCESLLAAASWPVAAPLARASPAEERERD
jgi:hypothetical protein